MTDDEMRVLEMLRPRRRDAQGVPMRLPLALVRPADDAVGWRLAGMGLLDRQRKPGRGGGWWYVITDAGVAALPEVDPYPKGPDVIPGHSSP